MTEQNALQRVIALDKKSGKFVLDSDGYTRFVPSKAEREAIEQWLSDELARAIEDHKPLFAEARECIETYKATATRIPDSGESILPSPLARIPADQIIAWTVNTVLRARPIVSFDAYFDGDYDVVAPLTLDAPPMPAPPMGMGAPEMGMGGEMPMEGMGEMPMMGEMPGMGMEPMGGMEMGGMPMAPPAPPQPTTIPVPVKKSAEEIARALEAGMEFKNRERLDFERLLWTLVADCVTGAAPSWIKVYREKRTRSMLVPSFNGIQYDVREKEERFVSDGEEVRYVNVPVFNVLMPIEEDDPDISPWLAERTPRAPEHIVAGHANDSLFLIDSKEEAAKLAAVTSTEVRDEDQQALRATTQKRMALAPRPKCDVYEVWFYRTLRVIDPDTGKPVIREFSLMGDFHLGARRLMSCYRNPYDHQKRIHVPSWQIKDPHSHAGSSTVGNLRYHQKIATHLMQAEIKNAFLANNFVFWYDENSPAADYFAKNKTWRPGDVVPGVYGQDWGASPAGTTHFSLLPTQQWVTSSAQQSSNVSSYETGDTIPGRTPAATVSQILQQGQQQPLLFLRMLNQSITRAVKLYLETARQYQPMGETIPVRDPETRAMIEVPFRFPVGEALDNFRVSLTAADEALAKEHEPEQLTMLMNLWQQHTQFIAGLAGPMMNPQATEQQTAFFLKAAEGEQAIFDLIISSMRTDRKKFDLKPALDGIVREKAMLQQQMEAMNAANQASGGGPVPGAEGGNPGGGPPGVPGEPGMAPPAGPPPTDDMGVPPFVQ